MFGNERRVLISGAGIAGLTAAFWFHKHGMDVTIVEKAPALRQGGYMIDFWGIGFDVAEKMGILDELAGAHYNITEFEFVNERSERRGGFSVSRLRKMIDYRHFNLLRSDLERVLYEKVRDKVEIIFSCSIRSIDQTDSGAHVVFENGSEKEFGIVIGADGLHSNVRKILFGPEEQFEKFLGYYVSSFTIENYLNREHAFLGYSTPGKQASIYSLRDGKLATFFIFKAEEELTAEMRKSPKDVLRKVFGNEGWECPRLLERMEKAPDFYFDTVSQIRMGGWSRGRTVLIGDACQCVSLIAGEGSGFAMAGAYILAGEFNEHERIGSAFQSYESILKPEIQRKQKLAEDFASTFVPESNFWIWIRNTFTNLMFLPFVSRRFINKYMKDELELKDYESVYRRLARFEF
jgi:2-polyprenyl-6-methoxyphenol hydroxylase-like FAD-dependent oxidoreductase